MWAGFSWFSNPHAPLDDFCDRRSLTQGFINLGEFSDQTEASGLNSHQGELVPINAMKENRWNRGRAPLIPSLSNTLTTRLGRFYPQTQNRAVNTG